MKDIYIENLESGQRIEAHAFIIDKFKESETKTGKTYLNITFADKTGTINAKVWANSLGNCDTVGEGDIVSVTADVSEYNGSAQLVVDEMRLLDDFDPADFMATSVHDDDEQFNILQDYINSLKNPYLKALLESLFDDNAFVQEFKRAFGAEKAHHAFLGGLMEHTNEMISFVEPVAKAYPEINRDLLVTGVIIHDIGKMYELSVQMKVTRTRRGHLWGHIVQGVDLINRQIDLIDGFPDELREQVIHLIISHHGKLEFGSPIKPMTIEAVALNYIDMLSSKLNMIRNLQKTPRNGDGITDFSYLLEGRFYFSDENYDETEVEAQVQKPVKKNIKKKEVVVEKKKTSKKEVTNSADEINKLIDAAVVEEQDYVDIEGDDISAESLGAENEEEKTKVIANGQPQKKEQLDRNLQMPF